MTTHCQRALRNNYVTLPTFLGHCASPCGLTALCDRTILSNHTSSSVNVVRKFYRTSRQKILTSSFRFLSFPHFVLSIIFSFFHCSFIGRFKKVLDQYGGYVLYVVQSESTGRSKRYLSVTEYYLSNTAS
jgi:hypothetical protein